MNRRSCARACAALAASWALSTAVDARANGRFPAAQVLFPAPNDPSLFVLRATFGILISHDKGVSWDWICEAGVGYASSEDPSMAVTANDTILAGAFEGLFTSSDIGCAWTSTAGGISDTVVDLAMNPGNPHAGLLLTSGYAGLDDAGSTFASQIWSTTDDGATWTKLGAPLDRDVLPETIDLAPSDPTHLYVSGTRIETSLGPGRQRGHAVGVILASTDDAASWTQTTIHLDLPYERAPYIAAVDPLDETRVYVRIDGTTGTRVLVTTDGAKTFNPVWKARGALLGFAVSSDGSKIYAGGPNDGMNVAQKSDMTFVQKSTTQIQCLAIAAGTLYACSNEVSGFVVGSSVDDGATFTPMLHLCSVRGPLECNASSAVTTQCAPNWPTQLVNLGGACVPPVPDAGTVHADAGGASNGAAGASSSSCGCSSPGAASATPLAGVVLLGIAIGVGRRRKRARRGD